MGEQTFRTDLRYIVRGLWQSVISQDQFESQMSKIIEDEISKAWAEGASECGIAPDEYEESEQLLLKAFIVEQQSYIQGFADAISENNKKKDGDIFPLFERAKLWLNRYGEARNQSKALACADTKYEWRINAHCKEHCSSCTRLNGKVKRGSYWAKTIMPRSRDLECGGFRCCCDLVPTDKPISKGRLSF